MTSLQVVYRPLRDLVLSLFLFWAFMLQSQDALALEQTSPAHATAVREASTLSSASPDDALTCVTSARIMAREATQSSFLLGFTPEGLWARSHLFNFLSCQDIAPDAARTAGINFLSKFFLTSIQPHAP